MRFVVCVWSMNAVVWADKTMDDTTVHPQVLVESLDSAFENVCELDLVFHFDEVRYVVSPWYDARPSMCVPFPRRHIISSPKSYRADLYSRRTSTRSTAPVSPHRHISAPLLNGERTYIHTLPYIHANQCKRPRVHGRSPSCPRTHYLSAVAERSVLGVPVYRHPWGGSQEGSLGSARGKI